MFKLLVFCVFFMVMGIGHGFNHGQSLKDFDDYTKLYDKLYTNTSVRTFANYNFINNRNHIAQHNAQEERKQSTYREAVNQFSDLSLHQIINLFPKAEYTVAAQNATPTATTVPTDTEYDIIMGMGMTIDVEDQGTQCSSSWAYAAAKAIQILNGIQTAVLTPEALSAQELIDCAGMGTGCSTQNPQTAFDFLKLIGLTTAAAYPNNNGLATQGVCATDQMMTGIKLATYSTIKDADDIALKRFVFNNIPVIVEYNPDTFGFMEYSSGVYVPPKKTKAIGSQFLVVVGYGHDTDLDLDYWRCLNSFGTTWGENGYIRIIRSAKYPLAKKAIFPNTL
ncbi:uncharacterized protein [Drosophila tropicalis]|uniref:uncharacterized protein n=1 Tax=Drosophila tropicalis TaxID=46794 RepID=UPI0035ABB2BF